MARGWESKSVEAQMETADEGARKGPKPPLTDGEKRARHERDSLKLSRAYIVHQIEASTNERYTRSLQQALSEIDEKLAKLVNGR
jgi:hypothetical protein